MFQEISFTTFYDADAALDVLAAVLARPACLADIAPLLSAEDFEPDCHRPLWQTLVELEQRGVRISKRSVGGALAETNCLEAVGGIMFLDRLVSDFYTRFPDTLSGPLPDLSGPVSRLRALALRRRVLELWLSLYPTVYDSSLSPRDAVAGLRAQVTSFKLHPSDAPGADEAQGRAAPFSADRLAEQSFDGPLWLLDRLFLRGGVNLLAGEITSGKTFLALDLAIAAAAGLPAWDNRACSAGPVLYFCQDSGAGTMQRRLLALCAGRGLAPPTRLLFDFSPLNLATPEGMQCLLDLVQRHKAVLVILDALARYLPGVDENNVAGIGPVFTGLRTAASQSGAGFVIVHHFNKSAAYTTHSAPTAGMSRVRGSSDITAAVDAALSVTLGGSRRQSTRLITPEKNRELPEEPALEFSIEPQGRDGLALRFSSGEDAAASDGQIAAAVSAARELLRASPGQAFTRRDLEGALAAAGHSYAPFILHRLFASLPAAPGIQATRQGRFKTYSAAPEIDG